MKLLIIGLLFLTIFTSDGFAWYGFTVDTVEVRYPNNDLKEQYQTLFSYGAQVTYKYGYYRSWYDNDQLEWEGHYVRDIKTGSWIKWDSTGYRIAEVNYSNGLKHGIEIEWNRNGTLRKKLHYRNGKLHGLCIWKKANTDFGTICNNHYLTYEREAFYLDSILIVTTRNVATPEDETSFHSIRSPIYNKDLDLWMEWEMYKGTIFVGRKVDDKKHGIWVLWSKTGDMIKSVYYNMGVLLE